ncbi:type III-A CRISPR-associated protein Cas10/Csm1, partial [Staphylococcus epidermidis]
IEASIYINDKFKEFTLDKLTLSAGVGMFSGKYPVSKMAFETGRLEEAAKTGEKNQISLWLQEKVYNWDEFKKNILEEKLLVLQ